MKAITPYTLRSGAIVDGEGVNDNLRTSARNVGRNLSRRYTHAPAVIIPLDTVTDALTSALRSIVFDRPTANNPVEIEGVELVIYATAGVTWTLSVSGATWSSITLDTAGTTTEAKAVSDQAIAVPNGGVTFTVSASGASTIARGWIALYLRNDRGVQGVAPNHAGYTPTFVDATTSSAGSVLDTQLTALAAAVTNDATNSADLRCACFLARNLTVDQSWNLPSGAGFTGLTWRGYIVATAADQFDVGGSLSGATLTGTGTSNIVSATDTVTSTADAPTTAASDFSIDFTGIVGPVELAYVFVWWS